MKEIEYEPMDHELHRLPCTKSMKDHVRAAAKRLGITEAGYQRMAIAERMEREQAKR